MPKTPLVLPEPEKAGLSARCSVMASARRCTGLLIKRPPLTISVVPSRRVESPRDMPLGLELLDSCFTGGIPLGTSTIRLLRSGGSLLATHLLLGLGLGGALRSLHGRSTGNGGLTEVGAVTSLSDVVGDVLVSPVCKNTSSVYVIIGPRLARVYDMERRTCGCGH